MPDADPIEHIVMLMLENHSFDQMLGCMQAVNPEIDGVSPAGEPHSQRDYPDRNHYIAQFPADERFLDPEPNTPGAAAESSVLEARL